MVKLAKYIKTLKELEEMFEDSQFLEDLDNLGRDPDDDLQKQLEEIAKIDKFKIVKEIEIEEASLIKQANVTKPLNLEHKG